MRVAAAKLSGIACLRDTLNMADHGAIAIASFLDCGLPSTVGATNLSSVAKTIIARLNESSPDLIVIELGDGLLGGYSVESVFDDLELREATAALVFCASDYVGAWGGIEFLRRRGIEIDVIAGSVTDSQMGEDFIEKEFGVPAANARRNGARLFELIKSESFEVPSPKFRVRTQSFCTTTQLLSTTESRREGLLVLVNSKRETRNAKLRVGIFGGSGYGGSELLRILLFHPNVEIVFVTANEQAGKAVSEVHRNLYGLTDLHFTQRRKTGSAWQIWIASFSALPHGQAMEVVPRSARESESD